MTSPFLAGRNPAYIIASASGIVCLSLFVLQPILAALYLPGLNGPRARTWHRVTGSAIVLAVLLHVGGLYVSSPPDALDALLLTSPTPFSVYGVIALWGVLLTAALVAFRKRLPLRYSTWRIAHNAIAFIIITATVIHALQIEGTMEPVSKWMICIGVLAITTLILLDLRIVGPWLKRRAKNNSAK